MSFLAETNVQKSKHSLIKYGGTEIGALSNLYNYKNSENVWNDSEQSPGHAFGKL